MLFDQSIIDFAIASKRLRPCMRDTFWG